MNLLKQGSAIYMMVVAAVVAVFFVINTFLADAIDVATVWLVLDVLMAIGLGAAIVVNSARKVD